MTVSPRLPGRRLGLLLLGALLLLAGGRRVLAQAGAQASQDAGDEPPLVAVAVAVTAVSGGSVYLDKGREAHIEPGDAVVLYPIGGPTLQAVVTSVSRTSSRAELPPGASLNVGDRGEVLVPEARAQPAPADPDAPEQPPEHPPWTQPAEDFDATQPLLAPAYSRSEAERPMVVHGRFFTQFTGTWDEERDNAYELWRTGADVVVENPFEEGGQVHVAGDVFHRAAALDGAGDEQTTDGRLNRASYSWGGTRESPDRVEVGRFLQHEFPELGVLDGIELARRTDSGNRFGGSFGYMPRPFPDMKTGQDLQAAVFYRTDSDGRDPVEFGLAYQNTWHSGAQDRNLFVGTLEAEPNDSVRIFGEALVDYYGPGDDIKSDGFQVTEARLNSAWRIASDTGIGLHASHIRWPELKSMEFGDLTPQQILDNRVSRVGADGWHDFSESLRVDGRLDVWQDQEDEGSSGNLRAALRNVVWDRGELAIDVFTTAGAFTDGRGVRVSAHRAFESIGFGTLSWELSNYDSAALGGESTDLDQQALRASLDSSLGESWSLSVYAENRLGDSQDSFTLGIYLQERF